MASIQLLLLMLLPSFQAAVISNGLDLTNELANEKQLYYSNYNNQPQQRHPPPSIIANDLSLYQGAMSAPADRQHQGPKLVSHSAVINGNQATYVEPPADFKPIIYDYERQVAGDDSRLQSSHQQPQVGSSANNYNADQQQHARPMDDKQRETRRQQQQQLVDPQQQQAYRGQAGGDSQLLLLAADKSNLANSDQNEVGASQSANKPLLANSNSDAPNGGGGLKHASTTNEGQSDQASNGYQANSFLSAQLPSNVVSNYLKPSIGRWSDWHEMNIEPDLASSDTAETASFYHHPIPDNAKSAVPARSPFRIRNKATGDNNSGAISAARGIGLPTDGVAGDSGDLESAETKALEALNRIERRSSVEDMSMPANVFIRPSPASSSAINQLSFRRPLQQQQQLHLIPPVSQMKETSQQQPVNSQPSSAEPASRFQLQSANKPTANSFASSPNNLVKLQLQQVEDVQLRYAGQPQPNLDNQHVQREQDYSVKAPANDPSAAHQRQTRLQQPANESSKRNQTTVKRRRLKRRRKSSAAHKASKTNAEVRILQLVAVSQQQQQQEHQIGQKQVTGDNGGQFLARSLAASPPRQISIPGERVLARQAPGQPTVIMRRFGTSMAVPSSPNLPIQAGNGQLLPDFPAKKIVKRRRIKSQLPVGLSSWFLGGIRDLDGRHWQLPAEVINRLVINDVDLAHPSDSPISKVEPPATGSVVLLDEQKEPQTTIVAQPAVVARVPISQLFPRR